METGVNIFIMYAKEDTAFKDELIVALSPLKKQGWVQAWHDGDITPGGVWDQEIRYQLNRADLILPLLSPDFFASDHIQNVEIAHAFERQKTSDCRIVPIIIRACAWQTDMRLASLTSLPSNGKPIGSWSNADEAYQDVVMHIKQLIRPGVQSTNDSFSKSNQNEMPNQPPQPTTLTQKVIRYKTQLEIAAALTAILTFVFTYCPIKPTDAATEKALQEAKNKGTIPVMREFLIKHPDGKTAEEAKAVLHILEHRFDSCLQSAKALRDGGEVNAARESAAAAAKINPTAPELRMFLSNPN